MAHEILSVKLNELDKKIARFHSRIHVSETEDEAFLSQSIQSLRQDCEEEHAVLKNRLLYSKNEAVGTLSQAYQAIEQTISHSQASLEQQAPQDSVKAAEEKILVAEYALDFAIQAADHALLYALEAIQSEKDMERSSQ